MIREIIQGGRDPSILKGWQLHTGMPAHLKKSLKTLENRIKESNTIDYISVRVSIFYVGTFMYLLIPKESFKYNNKSLEFNMTHLFFAKVPDKGGDWKGNENKIYNYKQSIPTKCINKIVIENITSNTISINIELHQKKGVISSGSPGGYTSWSPSVIPDKASNKAWWRFGGAEGDVSPSINYTVINSSVGKPGGNYVSNSGPAAAAKKAASKRFGSKMNMRLTIRETGTGTDREFTYDATRVNLPNPIVRNIGGVKVTSKYRVDVKAVK